MKELVPAVQKLWTGDYAHDGHYWKFPQTAAVPKPLQKGHPPIWVAARDPGTFDWAVSIGANILSTPLSLPAAEIAVLGEKFNKAVADNPHGAAPALHDAAPHLRVRQCQRLGTAGQAQHGLWPCLRKPDAEHRHRAQRFPRAGAV